MQRCTACDHFQFVDLRNCERCGAPMAPSAEVEGAGEPGPSAGSLEAEVLQIAAQTGKIDAIKRYRQATNASLKEAKDAVEALMTRYRVPARSGKAGCAGMVLLLCLGTLSLALLMATSN